MRYSQMLIPTAKETPAEAEVISHQLLLRGGFIRKLTSGLYTYLPIGLMAMQKVEKIVRQEMNRAGAQELLMPMVQPADLWQESGRWKKYGPELLRFKDRHDRDYCLGPTHEEVITDIARRELHSYRQLPMNLYQKPWIVMAATQLCILTRSIRMLPIWQPEGCGCLPLPAKYYRPKLWE